MSLRPQNQKSLLTKSCLTWGLVLGALSVNGVVAQTSPVEFRQSFSLEDNAGEGLELVSESDLEAFESLNEAEDEKLLARPPVATVRAQLTRANRSARATKFSERTEAVMRLSQPANGAERDEGVFDGQTVQDRPVGIHMGSLRLLPSLDAGLGWTDNAEQVRGGTPDGFYGLDAAVAVISDWDRHALGVELRGSLRAFFDEPDNNQPVVTGLANLRLDLGGSTRADFEGGYSFSREQRASAENEVASGPTNSVQEIEGSFSLSRQVSVVQLRGGLGINRSVYDGQSSGSGQRDNTVFTSSLRASFDNGAMFEPYLEGGFLVRKYDHDCNGDPTCLDRTSGGYSVQAGLRVDRGPKLRGEFGVGWRAEYLDDARLDALQGLIFDGAFVWSPTRRDTVTMSGATSFNATNISGASGSILYAGDVRYARQITQDLVGDIQLGYTYRTYQGVDVVEQEASGSIGLVWAFAKDAAILSRYTFQAFDSSSAESDYTSSLVEAGLRIRR